MSSKSEGMAQAELDLRMLDFQLRKARRDLRTAQTELNALGTAAANAKDTTGTINAKWWQTPLAAVVGIALLLNLPRIFNIYRLFVQGAS